MLVSFINNIFKKQISTFVLNMMDMFQCKKKKFLLKIKYEKITEAHSNIFNNKNRINFKKYKKRKNSIYFSNDFSLSLRNLISLDKNIFLFKNTF